MMNQYGLDPFDLLGHESWFHALETLPPQAHFHFISMSFVSHTSLPQSQSPFLLVFIISIKPSTSFFHGLTFWTLGTFYAFGNQLSMPNVEY